MHAKNRFLLEVRICFVYESGSVFGLCCVFHSTVKGARSIGNWLKGTIVLIFLYVSSETSEKRTDKP